MTLYLLALPLCFVVGFIAGYTVGLRRHKTAARESADGRGSGTVRTVPDGRRDGSAEQSPGGPRS